MQTEWRRWHLEWVLMILLLTWPFIPPGLLVVRLRYVSPADSAVPSRTTVLQRSSRHSVPFCAQPLKLGGVLLAWCFSTCVQFGTLFFRAEESALAVSSISIFPNPFEIHTTGFPISLTLGHCHNFFCRDPILKLRIVLDSQALTTRGKVLDFFVKPKNGLVTLVFEKGCFPGCFRDKIGPLSSNRFFSKSEANCERKSSWLNIFLEKMINH